MFLMFISKHVSTCICVRNTYCPDHQFPFRESWGQFQRYQIKGFRANRELTDRTKAWIKNCLILSSILQPSSDVSFHSEVLRPLFAPSYFLLWEVFFSDRIGPGLKEIEIILTPNNTVPLPSHMKYERMSMAGLRIELSPAVYLSRELGHIRSNWQ